MSVRICKHLIGLVLAVALVPSAGCSDPQAPLEAEHAGSGHATHPAGTADLASNFGPELAALRRITAPFHHFEKTLEAGYVDAITPCWAHRTDGAMGFHYGKAELIGDGRIDLLEPELLMYEPQRGGHLRLVGLEYIVLIDDWHRLHGADAPPPSLLGQAFHPHSFLPIYKLHIWLWRDNPRGLFADWNPKVSCKFTDNTEVFD